MTQKINTLYKPNELIEAQQALIKADLTPDDASTIIITFQV